MKVMVLMINDSEEAIFNKIIFFLSNEFSCEIIKPISSPVLSFPGLEIRSHQRWVLQDGEEINLTRLEYNTLVFLAFNSDIVLTRTQIFEVVWNMAIIISSRKLDFSVVSGSFKFYLAGFV